MNKAAEMAKTTTKGSFHLLWGLVASTIISAVGTVYIANLLLSDGMGLYSLAIAAPTLIGVFRDWGVNSALVRYTAQYNSEKQTHRIRRILVTGLMFEVVAGVVLTVVSFLLSSVFASLYNHADITPLIQIASFTILINAFFTVAQSTFTGLERMELNSITLIVQSVIKVVLTIALVILGLGVFGAIVGYSVALLLAGVTGALFMFMLYRKLPTLASSQQLQLESENTNDTRIKDDIRTLLTYGLPLSVSAIISAFQLQFYTILIGVYATTNAVGNYALATTFVVLITFFASPITTVLFPAFSKLDPQKDKEALKSVYQFSVKYAALLVVPVAAIVMSLSQPAISTLFGNKYAEAPLFLSLLSITYVFTAFGSLTAGNLIVGQGKTGLSMKLSILTAAIGIPLSVILVSQIGVIGIIITTLIAGLPGLVISLLWIKKHYDLTIDWKASVKILFSSALAGLAAFMLPSWLSFASWLSLIIGVATFILIFLPSILLTRTINQADVENLRQMTTSLGPINRVLKPALNLIEKLVILTQKSSTKQPKSTSSEPLPL